MRNSEDLGKFRFAYCRMNDKMSVLEQEMNNLDKELL